MSELTQRVSIKQSNRHFNMSCTNARLLGLLAEKWNSAQCTWGVEGEGGGVDVSPVVVFNAAAWTPPSNLINGDINLSTSQPSRPGI